MFILEKQRAKFIYTSFVTIHDHVYIREAVTSLRKEVHDVV